jgi:hypothetical protein
MEFTYHDPGCDKSQGRPLGASPSTALPNPSTVNDLAATRIFQYTGVSPLIEFGTASVKSLFTTRPRWLSRNLIEYGAGLCGMACLISPLLLWVSWSQEALKGILIFAFGALFITLWLTQFWGEE